MENLNKVQTVCSQIENVYLDYFNNFLTTERFAEHYNIPEDVAEKLLELGRFINNHEPIDMED